MTANMEKFLSQNPSSPEQAAETEAVAVEQVSAGGMEAETAVVSEVSEHIRESIGENIPQSSGQDDTAVTTKKKTNNTSRRISDLLFSDSRASTKQLPPVHVQRQKVEQALEQEMDTLVKKSRAMMKNRHFSAAKLEKVVERIRMIEKLLSEMLQLAADQIERLYRRYVMK